VYLLSKKKREWFTIITGVCLVWGLNGRKKRRGRGLAFVPGPGAASTSGAGGVTSGCRRRGLVAFVEQA
jgi:hypothetical protein